MKPFEAVASSELGELLRGLHQLSGKLPSELADKPLDELLFDAIVLSQGTSLTSEIKARQRRMLMQCKRIRELVGWRGYHRFR